MPPFQDRSLSDVAPPTQQPASAGREDQPLQFHDRRTAVAFLAGIVVLALIGVAGGALFRDSCDELFSVGERRTFVQGDPAEVLPDDPTTARGLLAYGDGAGLGAWRGSVVLDQGTEVIAATDGFLVFTSTGIDALEPGLMAVNASRSTADRRAIPALHGAAVGASGEAPYEVAVLDEDLALIGCGRVVRDDPVLAIDRVRALHSQGPTLEAVGLDGRTDWSRAFDHEVVRAELLLGAALVVTAGDVHLVQLEDGETLQRWPLDAAQLLALDAGHAVVHTPRRTVRLGLADGRSTDVDVDVDPARGVALIDDRVVAGAGLPPLPGPLEVLDLHATEGGYVGVEVQAPGGQRRLLLYGPALASAT